MRKGKGGGGRGGSSSLAAKEGRGRMADITALGGNSYRVFRSAVRPTGSETRSG